MIYEPFSKRRHIKGRSLRERGQSLIELAISGTILLLILMGIIDITRVYFVYIALVDSAAEGALYTSLYPGCPYPSASCPTGDNGYDRAKDAASGYFTWNDGGTTTNGDGTTDLTVTVPAFYGTGSTVEVTLTHDITLLTPLIPPIAGTDTITITAYASQIVLGE